MRATAPATNPYRVLGLELGADEQEVRAAFRRLAKTYHPDVPDSGDAAMFESIRRAAEELSTADGRARWGSPTRKRARWTRRTRAKAARNPSVILDNDLSDEAFFEAFCGDAADLNDLDGPAASGGRSPSSPSAAGGLEGKGVAEQWLAKKRARRLLRRRANLMGGASKPRPVVEGAATEETMSTLTNVVATWLGVTPAMLSPDTPLAELGFFDVSFTDDLAKVLMALEDVFNVDLADVVEGRQIKFELPADISTISQLADLIESKL